MPINDILAEKTGVDPRVRQQQIRQQMMNGNIQQSQGGQPTPQSGGRADTASGSANSVEPSLQIDVQDLQWMIQFGQLLVLLYIAYKL
jgi:hypothetical protein